MIEEALLSAGLLIVVAKLAEGILRRFRLNAIVAYTAAGILLGPVTGVVDPTGDVHVLLGIGIFLFFFLIGLDELDISGFIAAIHGRFFLAALISVLIPVLATLALTFDLVHDFGLGLDFTGALALAGVLSLTSLGVVAKVLIDEDRLRSPVGIELFTTALIAELLVLLMVGFSIGDHTHQPTWDSVLILLAKIAGFVMATWVLAGRVIPPLLVLLRDILRVPQLSFGLILGGLFVAVVCAEWMGLHGSLGALLLGAALSRLPYQVRREIVPGMRSVADGLFVPLFFSSAGLYLSLSFTTFPAWTIVALVVVPLAGKFAGASIGALAARLDMPVAVATGLMAKGVAEIALLLVFRSQQKIPNWWIWCEYVGMGKKVRIQLAPGDRDRLEALIANGNTPQKHVRRAQIVLLAGDGMGTTVIQRRLRVSRPTVRRWRTRYVEAGVDGLCHDKTRPPGKPPLGAAVVSRVIAKTKTETPPDATHWSLRTMAKAVGIAPSSVHAIWKAHGLKPHLVATFKLSNDPRFAEKLEDVVGLYLNPPEHAIVLSLDEKSQIQALDRTQPGLPMKKGRAGTMTHDYKRHGTTTLFAALDVLDGRVIGQCMQRHRHQEFIRFLNKINRDVAPNLDVHLIADNYATHKHSKVKAWLARHPRFHMHFTPTSASWLNLVERFFAEITRKRIRRGVFHSIADLQMAINDYLDQHNADPIPFVWTASAASIIKKVNRGKQVLESQH